MTADGRPVLLALRALGLGDLLTVLPCLRALARAYPDHRRILAAPPALRPLLELAGAGFELLAVDGPERRLEPLVGRTARPDVAVNLHGRGPESHRSLLSLRPTRLIAFANEGVPGSQTLPRWRPGEHEVERWCRLLRESGIAADPSDLTIEPPPAPEAAGATIVHPGAASPARRWPPERFAAVARAERDRGGRVLVTGTPAERGLARWVARTAGVLGQDVWAGRTHLVRLAALVGAADLMVCGDTGVAHLATAVGTPSVVLFGPTSPERWGPPADRPAHRALWRGSEGDPHADRPDPGLLAIGVPDVMEAIGDLRARVGAGPGATVVGGGP
ncbi:MAG: glycosyltransferase family 9 protein [Candidatus Velamenicoccus archaeovorus]